MFESVKLAFGYHRRCLGTEHPAFVEYRCCVIRTKSRGGPQFSKQAFADKKRAPTALPCLIVSIPIFNPICFDVALFLVSIVADSLIKREGWIASDKAVARQE